MESKTYRIVVRDVNIWTGKNADKGSAALVTENPTGCLMALPNGTSVKMVPMQKTAVPALRADRYSEGFPAWVAFYEANRGKEVEVTVSALS